MKKKYPTIEEAAAEYAAGDVGVITEALLKALNECPLYVLFPVQAFREPPEDARFPATPAEINSWPVTWQRGYMKPPWPVANYVLTLGTATMDYVDWSEPGTEKQRRGYLTEGGRSQSFAPKIIQVGSMRVYRPKLERALAPYMAEDAKPASGGRWPWGSHETKLLGILGEAGAKFWKLYDPADEGTAPKNADVEAWLEERGVSHRIAQSMATILRPDGLRTGPRE